MEKKKKKKKEKAQEWKSFSIQIRWAMCFVNMFVKLYNREHYCSTLDISLCMPKFGIVLSNISIPTHTHLHYSTCKVLRITQMHRLASQEDVSAWNFMSSKSQGMSGRKVSNTKCI